MTATLTKKADVFDPLSFRLLNQDVMIHSPESWDSPDLDRLTRYHLHYHDFLHSQTRVNLDDSGRRIIGLWIKDNPPLDGTGWEPYPLSRRICNWITWSLREGCSDVEFTESLVRQVRALEQQLEIHLMANHLMANAKALLMAGLYFEGREASDWFDTGLEILLNEIDHQILDDGGHFERSPMYHFSVLEDFLDIANAYRCYGLSIPEVLKDTVQKMLHWGHVMTHQDGRIGYFNDSVDGMVPSLRDLTKYASNLCIESSNRSQSGFSYLVNSGYARYASEQFSAIIDFGEIGPDYQPGHAHCDCLSFECSLNGEIVITNRGISTYEVGEQRNLERSTEAHNTVSLTGTNQCEIWHGFRVGRRLRVGIEQLEPGLLSASHTGFRHVGAMHHRTFRKLEGGGLAISDTLEARGDANSFAHFHFAPGFEPVVEDRRVTAGGLRLDFEGADQIVCCDYEYCRGFNWREPARKLVVAFKDNLRTELTF